VRFTINFSIQERNLATNQSVVLAIPAGQAREVVSVHKDAVINRKGKNIVFIVEDGAANIRPVKLGEAIGPRFVVLGGLKAGDTIVVRGNERLRPGQKVKH
jgi:multidrug efflux pump subunit AcrA (membrane-fusion protein)